ncbi:hypothetical protein [Ligilactobacillus agilis]|uniref:hypothetical protein n=1 Tax=Ligilactobacillus agilis TaxID=1601 RepID=UPI001959CDDD|nr:hypothetical protein [Ligilactobacillus agilis]MBM6763357.1 hypothetical protein [Ligilactobacillus agilis]
MEFLQTIITTLKNKLTATAAICILIFLLVVHPSFWDLLFTAIIMVPITLILNSKKEK